MASMRETAEANGLGLVVMTIVPKGFFSEAWNATNDFFEEPKAGLIHDLLGCKDSGMLVYNRCDQLVGELQMSSPKVNDIVYEWKILRKASSDSCNTPKPHPDIETAEATTPGNRPT